MIQRLVAIVGLVLVPLVAIGADYPLTDANTVITFVGTKPNGKHEGGFKGIKGTASADNNDPATLKIALDIDMEQLYSDNPKLTSHLKAPDFFSVKANPKAKFVTTKIEGTGGDYKVTGNLTMVGETKSITFPARITVTGDSLTLVSSFSIDKTQWGMKYGQGKIDDQVKLTVSVKASK